MSLILALVDALMTLLSWPTIFYVLLGTFIGVTFGAVPGLGGVVALSILIPITWGWDSIHAFALFGSVIGGTAFGGSVSAIIINTPGSAVNAATCFDGYPLSRQGRCNEALGISATASVIGALIGIMALLLLIPVTERIVLAFGNPEYTLLAILGIVIISSVSDNVSKGLIAGGLGMLVGMIGYAGATGEYRFGFGTDYLWEGIQLVALVIGLFAIAEIIKLSSEGGSISNNNDGITNKSSVRTGVKRVLNHPSLLFRSSIIGLLVGMVPGAGASVANFVAYGQAVQTSKNSEKFGNGDPRGIIASEGSNDATDGGALIPTIAFGVPGSAPMAVLLAAFILHGLQPGPDMLGPDLNIFLIIVSSLIISNILTSAVGIFSADHLSKLTKIPVDLIIPTILVVSLIGAYAARSNIGDVFVALIFGLIGYIFIVENYSRVSFIVGFILAPIAETSYHISMSAYGTHYVFVQRPISLLLVISILLIIVSIFIKER